MKPTTRPRRSRARYAAIALGAGIAVTLAAGCAPKSSNAGGGSSAAAPAANGGNTTITIAYPADLESWSPYATISSQTYSRWSNIYEPLVSYANDKYVPVLATSWSVAGNVWTFQLRKGVKFQDGSPFTSADVVYSLNRAANDKTSLMQSHTVAISKVVADGPSAVKIYTKGPNAVLPANLTSVFITSQASQKKYGANADEHPNGTGPYSFVSWVKGATFTVKKNPEYWGKEPASMPGTIVFKIIPDPTDAVAALQNGEIDIDPNLPFQDVTTINNGSSTHVTSVPGVRTMFYGFNVKIPPFNNEKLRQAITSAIDTKSIIKNVLQGEVVSSNGPVPAVIAGSDPTMTNPFPYNPTKAKQLFAESGVGNTPITLVTTNGSTPGDAEVSQAIQQELQAVGMNVTLKTEDIASDQADLAAGKLGFYAGNRGNYFDASVFIEQYFMGPIDKRTGYDNPQLDSLMHTSDGELDQTKRQQELDQAESILMNEAPAVFFGAYNDIYGVSDKIAAWTPNPSEFIQGISISVE